ncbi:Sec translocon accessory complex subunit YajC [Halomonadaceae bacterium LMG 33818]|uniref:preprotein translocase subunit YajC n=1 Tax=Cernens ardua TaxID=3402176 RepID=UPI003EDB98C7
MLNLLISPAYAAEGSIASSGALPQILMIVAFAVIFYFLLWRPQAKRAKAHRQLVTELSKGDEVVVGGGLAGRVTKVGDEFIVLEIAPGTEVNVQKSAVATVLPKNTLKSI